VIGVSPYGGWAGALKPRRLFEQQLVEAEAAAMAGSGRTMLGFPLLVPLRKSRRGTPGRDGVRSPKPAWRRW